MFRTFLKMSSVHAVFPFQDVIGNASNFELSLERMAEPEHLEKTVMLFLSFLIQIWVLFATPFIIHTASKVATEKETGIKVFHCFIFVSLRLFLI